MSAEDWVVAFVRDWPFGEVTAATVIAWGPANGYDRRTIREAIWAANAHGRLIVTPWRTLRTGG